MLEIVSLTARKIAQWWFVESRSLGSVIIELEYIFYSSGTAVAAQSIILLHISQALQQGSP